eukprot:scaffold15283_cov26-Tisochrysis_lutea.AAC.1
MTVQPWTGGKRIDDRGCTCDGVLHCTVCTSRPRLCIHLAKQLVRMVQLGCTTMHALQRHPTAVD